MISKEQAAEKAIAELKHQKDLLELGLISEEEYNKKKEALSKYILGN